jgi:3',5'-cyclic AMP phosphodiesterase CpdA
MQDHKLFRFAIITDTHLKLVEGTEEMLWSTHQLANMRTRYAIQQLNLLEPDFVVHLGDKVHPVPGMPEYHDTVELFHQIFSELDCPLYVTPGNHDIGDKYRIAMPAPVVRPESVSLYHQHFGASYRSFTHRGCRFVLINSPILNSGLPLEEEQRRWLEVELAEHQGKRIFLFAHYPPFVRDPHEVDHYDNVDEPGRSWLLNLIAKHHVEALFAGHTHLFFYNRHAGVDLYTLPSAVFVRQDYSELFRVGPATDYGRNDLDKLGVFLIEVTEEGHLPHFVRTAGQTLGAGERPLKLASPPPLARPAAPGVELRHPWAEIVEIPYNYILDEFVRRKVRNDYSVLAMWEMGIRKVRVPISDLVDPEVRARMEALCAKGFQFTVFSFFPPQGSLLETLCQYHHLVATLEVIVQWDDVRDVIPQLRALKERIPARICLSKVIYTQSFSTDVDQYIRPGFRADEGDAIKAFLAQGVASEVVDGYAFRIGYKDDPWDESLAIAKLAGEIGCHASVTIQLASDSEAGVVDDDVALAGRVCAATAAASVAEELDVFMDTFVDMDRGYYIRNGLVDRRYNPRLAGRVLAHLSSLLPSCSPHVGSAQSETIANGRLIQWETEQQRVVLCLAYPDCQISPLELAELAPSASGRCFDLATGAPEIIQWHRGRLTFDGEIPSLALILIE